MKTMMHIYNKNIKNAISVATLAISVVHYYFINDMLSD